MTAGNFGQKYAGMRNLSPLAKTRKIAMTAAGRREGFDARFVEPLHDQWTCPICQVAAREPRLTDCGHQFCFDCLRPLSRDGNVTCPVCRTELKEAEIYPNNMAKRAILNLMIYCDKQEEGCTWKGELRQRDEHNKECGHMLEVCDNFCEESVLRKDIKKHKESECSRRMVGCGYCDSRLEYRQLADHYKICDKYPVACHYQCGMQVARKDLKTHISKEGECPNSPVECDFGCQFIGNRKALQHHLNNETVSHLSLAMQSVRNLAGRLVSAERKQEETENQLEETEKKLAMAEKQWKEAEEKTQKVQKVMRSFMLEGWEMSMLSVDFARYVLGGNDEFLRQLSDNSSATLWKIKWSELCSKSHACERMVYCAKRVDLVVQLCALSSRSLSAKIFRSCKYDEFGPFQRVRVTMSLLDQGPESRFLGNTAAMDFPSFCYDVVQGEDHQFGEEFVFKFSANGIYVLEDYILILFQFYLLDYK